MPPPDTNAASNAGTAPPVSPPVGEVAAGLGRRLSAYVAMALISSLVGIGLARLPLVLTIGAIVGVASAIVVMIRPFLGLMLYTILFVLRPGEMYPVLEHLHLERIVGSLTLVSLILSQQRLGRGIFIDNTRQTRLLLLFLVAVVLSVPFAYWRQRAVDGFIEVLRIFGFYVMVVHLVTTRSRLKAFIWLFCLTVVYLAGTSLYSYLGGGFKHVQGIDRATGINSAAGNYDALGTTLASALPIFLLLAGCKSTGRFRPVFALGGILLVLTQVVTGSRASLLGLLAGLVFLWWSSRHRVVSAILGLGLLVAGFALMPQQYRQRYATITHSSLDGSSASRVITWKTGILMVVDRPVFGVGIRCFGAAHGMAYSSEEHPDYLEAHSLYIQVLAELGLVGAAVFFTFLYEVLRMNRRSVRTLLRERPDSEFEVAVLNALFAGLLVLLVSGVFGHSLLRRTWYVYAGVAVAIWRIHRDGLAAKEPGAVGSA